MSAVASATIDGETDRSDATLVRRAGAGDQQAWNDLVERFTGLVWHVARQQGLATSDAADVHQITWLRLVENLDRLRTPAAVGGWLATTAKREAWRVLRRRKREIAVEEPDDRMEHLVLTEPAAPVPDRDLLRRERDARVRAAFHRLPDRDQALLGLLASDPPATYKQVSAELDMPVGSIGPTRARCLERLRQQLDRDGVDGSLLAVT